MSFLEVKRSFPHFPWSYPPPPLPRLRCAKPAIFPADLVLTTFWCLCVLSVWSFGFLLLQHQTTSSPIFPSEGLFEMSGLLEEPPPPIPTPITAASIPTLKDFIAYSNISHVVKQLWLGMVELWNASVDFLDYGRCFLKNAAESLSL